MFKLICLGAFIQLNFLFAPKEITRVAIGNSFVVAGVHAEGVVAGLSPITLLTGFWVVGVAIAALASAQHNNGEQWARNFSAVVCCSCRWPRSTGVYKNYRYPSFIGVPFNPGTDEYPYPTKAIDITYDGLHPSDKGYAVIAGMLVKIMKKY